jgi:hypothetical protein
MDWGLGRLIGTALGPTFNSSSCGGTGEFWGSGSRLWGTYRDRPGGFVGSSDVCLYRLCEVCGRQRQTPHSHINFWHNQYQICQIKFIWRSTAPFRTAARHLNTGNYNYQMLAFISR